MGKQQDDRATEEARLRAEEDERLKAEETARQAARTGAPGSELTPEGQEAAGRNKAATSVDSAAAAKSKETAEEEAARKREEDFEANRITVKSGLKPVPATAGAPEGHRTALYEKDPAHPGGEAFIAGPTPVRVGPTPAVIAAIREGRLVEVDE